MSDKEIREMQLRIDKGILLAQSRLVKRARHDNIRLVIFRAGQVMEVSADELTADF